MEGGVFSFYRHIKRDVRGFSTGFLPIFVTDIAYNAEHGSFLSHLPLNCVPLLAKWFRFSAKQ